MMAFNSSTRKGPTTIQLMSPKSIADAASWYCALVLVALVLLTIFRDTSNLLLQDNNNNYYYYYYQHANFGGDNNNNNNNNNKIQHQQHVLLSRRPCEEIYVVGEGETLHTISDKCGDPFIVENNPHIHDPDDVFPGLVIKITPNSYDI